ncbi:MAG: trigger factor [Moorea sp. SIO2B7]|nr:trigger factor [Moorena sp. SIO2B7]
MKLTQEKLPASQIGLEIDISAENSKNTYEKVLRDLARNTPIPGFRKGKVPRQILLQRLGKSRIKAAVLEELIQKSLEQAIEQESIESLGNLKLLSNFEELVEKYKPGESLTFSASLDVPPTVEPSEYQSLNIKAEETVVEPNQIDDYLEELRVQKATLIPVEDRPSQMGDVAVVDYAGRFASDEEGGEIPGTKATNSQVELVEGQFIEGMVEGMVGMKPEETKEVPVTFPEDYPKEDLAGKEVIFTITLKELKEKELPELDDDFAEEASEFETMAEFRESLETQFKEKAAKETRNSIHAAIIEELVQKTSLELPETMIEKEVDSMLTETAMQIQQMGMNIKQVFTAEMIPQMRERSRPEAIQRIKQSLIILEIGKRESIEPDPEAVEARIKEITDQLSDREFDQDRLREMVEEDLLKEKTLDWIKERANVELVAKGSLTQSESEETKEEDGETISEETENQESATAESTEESTEASS